MSGARPIRPCWAPSKWPSPRRHLGSGLCLAVASREHTSPARLTPATPRVLTSWRDPAATNAGLGTIAPLPGGSGGWPQSFPHLNDSASPPCIDRVCRSGQPRSNEGTPDRSSTALRKALCRGAGPGGHVAVDRPWRHGSSIQPGAGYDRVACGEQEGHSLEASSRLSGTQPDGSPRRVSRRPDTSATVQSE